MKTTVREAAFLLAAVRKLQAELNDPNSEFAQETLDTATNADDFGMLDNDEIEQLCELLEVVRRG